MGRSNNNNQNLLCLLTGPSGSGKTSIALELQKRLHKLLINVPSATRNASATTTASTCGYNDGESSRKMKKTAATATAAIPNDDKDDTTTTTTTNTHAVIVIHQDQYFTKPFLPYKERNDDSYESGSDIDWDRLVSDIQSHFIENDAYANDDDDDDDNNVDNEDVVAKKKIIIVEGHILGNAAEIIRRKLLLLFYNNKNETEEDASVTCNYYYYNKVVMNTMILTILLVGCSKEVCKHRRLERKSNRSELERRELAQYIDDYMWPAYEKYGRPAMDTLRRLTATKATVELAVTTTASESTFAIAAEKNNTNTNNNSNNRPIGVVMEIDNADNNSACFETNIETLLNQIESMLLLRRTQIDEEEKK